MVLAKALPDSDLVESVRQILLCQMWHLAAN